LPLQRETATFCEWQKKQSQHPVFASLFTALWKGAVPTEQNGRRDKGDIHKVIKSRERLYTRKGGGERPKGSTQNFNSLPFPLHYENTPFEAEPHLLSGTTGDLNVRHSTPVHTSLRYPAGERTPSGRGRRREGGIARRVGKIKTTTGSRNSPWSRSKGPRTQVRGGGGEAFKQSRKANYPNPGLAPACKESPNDPNQREIQDTIIFSTNLDGWDAMDRDKRPSCKKGLHPGQSSNTVPGQRRGIRSEGG